MATDSLVMIWIKDKCPILIPDFIVFLYLRVLAHVCVSDRRDVGVAVQQAAMVMSDTLTNGLADFVCKAGSLYRSKVDSILKDSKGRHV
jgi:hypothetical protein